MNNQIAEIQRDPRDAKDQLFGVRHTGPDEFRLYHYRAIQMKTESQRTFPSYTWGWQPHRVIELSLDDQRIPANQRELFEAMHKASRKACGDTVFAEIVMP